MIKWLSDILGDNYTEDIDREVSKKIGEGFVSKEDFNELNAKRKALEVQIKDLKDSNASADDFKAKFEALEKEIKDSEEKSKAEQADKELTTAITSVFGEKKFTSDYVKNGIIADMKAEIAKTENKGKGYAELFESLTKDKDGIFANANPMDMGGINPNAGRTATQDSALRAAMGLPLHQTNNE